MLIYLSGVKNTVVLSVVLPRLFTALSYKNIIVFYRLDLLLVSCSEKRFSVK